ncbi:MAG: FeoA family protein [Prochlorotrichaceae cyanobacterium]|jgi:ferrous iron transport protein A
MFTGFTISGSSLSLLNVGEQGVISRFTNTDTTTTQTLKSLGLDLGTSIQIVKRFPTVVVSTGAAQIPLTKSLSRAIYVRTYCT